MVESGKASGHKADTSLARPHGSPSDTPWHTRDASEVLSALGVDTSTGLSTAQAAERRQQFGPNAMAAVRWSRGCTLSCASMRTTDFLARAERAVLQSTTPYEPTAS